MDHRGDDLGTYFWINNRTKNLDNRKGKLLYLNYAKNMSLGNRMGDNTRLVAISSILTVSTTKSIA